MINIFKLRQLPQPFLTIKPHSNFILPLSWDICEISFDTYIQIYVPNTHLKREASFYVFECSTLFVFDIFFDIL